METSTETLLKKVEEYLLVPLPSYPPFIVKGQGMTADQFIQSWKETLDKV